MHMKRQEKTNIHCRSLYLQLIFSIASGMIKLKEAVIYGTGPEYARQ